MGIEDCFAEASGDALFTATNGAVQPVQMKINP
jgi:hypothetical protein